MNFFKKAWYPKLAKSRDPFEQEDVYLVNITKFNNSCYPTQANYLRKKSVGAGVSPKNGIKTDTNNESEDDTNFNSHVNKDEISCMNRTGVKLSNVGLNSRKISDLIRSSDVNMEEKYRQKDSCMLPLLRVAPWANKDIKNRNYRSASMDLSITDIHSDSEFVPRRIRAAVSVYVLDHLMAAKRLELLENMHGGKFQAHRSATIIQRYFRNYQARKVSKRICSSNFGSSVVDSQCIIRRYSSRRKASRDGANNKLSRQMLINYDPDDPFAIKDDSERSRLFYLGINLFNRNSNKGVKFLINHKIVDADETSIVKFFETKGLSSYAKGDYMSQDNDKLASATRREYISKLSFHNCSIEKGVRKLFSHIRVPGETQKILNMIEEFNSVYLNQNLEFRNKLQNPDTVVMIAFSILMLHTSLFNPSAKKQDKMTKEDFVKIFRDYTKDPVIHEHYFDELYDNIKRQQIKPLSDHTDLVRNVYNHLVGPKIPKNLIQNHRKLICHYQLNEIPNITKKPNSHSHCREAFLFNDLILITKKTSNCSFHVRHEISLFGICINEFKTEYYSHGVELRRMGGHLAITSLDCINEEKRRKLMGEIRANIEELRQIDELRLEEEVEKVYLKK